MTAVTPIPPRAAPRELLAGAREHAVEPGLALHEITFPAGATIVREGTRGPRVLAFFVVVSGTVKVLGDGTEMATLGPGEYFGEIALLRNVPRTASVVAETDVRLLAASSWDFRGFVNARPAIGLDELARLAARSAA